MTAKEDIFRDDARAMIVCGVAVPANELREEPAPAHTPALDMEM